VSRSFFAFALTTILGLGVFSGCGHKAQEALWTAPDGTIVTWAPASPRFGDLVRLSARIPRQAGDGEADKTAIQALLIAPKGGAVVPISVKEEASERVIRWDFRAEASGEWTWGAGGHPLWEVASEAGSTTEFKSEDPQMLWSGKK